MTYTNRAPSNSTPPSSRSICTTKTRHSDARARFSAAADVLSTRSSCTIAAATIVWDPDSRINSIQRSIRVPYLPIASRSRNVLILTQMSPCSAQVLTPVSACCCPFVIAIQCFRSSHFASSMALLRSIICSGKCCESGYRIWPSSGEAIPRIEIPFKPSKSHLLLRIFDPARRSLLFLCLQRCQSSHHFRNTTLVFWGFVFFSYGR